MHLNVWKSIKLIVFLSHWYINGLLIPEIYVVRGKTYTFVVEGGDDKVRPASCTICHISIFIVFIAEVRGWLSPVLHN